MYPFDCDVCGHPNTGEYECSCHTCEVCLELKNENSIFIDRDMDIYICIDCAEELIYEMRKK